MRAILSIGGASNAVAMLATVPVDPCSGNARERILAGALALSEHGSHLFFRHSAHFHNPMVARELDALAGESSLDDPAVADVVEALVADLPGLALGIYSPVPIARGLQAARPVDELLTEFRYEMIEVDARQRWSWQGRPVAPKIHRFFLENTRYEAELGLWYFEYRVNDEWWDKSYFRGTTPLRVVSLDEAELEATLNNDTRDRIDALSFRLDADEQLFVDTVASGVVLVSDAVRFALLRNANEACDEIRLGEGWVPLAWPEGHSPT
ncbi:MAG: hypothetical protein VYE73_07675 [Acidobacteriota bacterium]|nr:hypothetical protein [Acidobacteriota bacterium]